MKLFGKRIARPCYDKFWRCPGWAGPGWKINNRGKGWCDNGSASLSGMDWERRWKVLGKELYAPWWTAWTCSRCGTLVLPAVIRYVDPRHWALALLDLPSRIKFAFLDWKDERRWRRSQRRWYSRW